MGSVTSAHAEVDLRAVKGRPGLLDAEEYWYDHKDGVGPGRTGYRGNVAGAPRRGRGHRLAPWKLEDQQASLTPRLAHQPLPR